MTLEHFDSHQEVIKPDYERLLDEIDNSSDPVGVALSGLCSANGVDFQALSQRRVQAYVTMYAELDYAESLPDVASFVSQFYGGNEELAIKEITVGKMAHTHPGSVDTYDPFLMISVEDRRQTYPTRFIQSPDKTSLGGAMIHMNTNEQGGWEATAMFWDSIEISQTGLPSGEASTPTVDLDLAVIRSIAKLIPISPFLFNEPVSGREIHIIPLH